MHKQKIYLAEYKIFLENTRSSIFNDNAAGYTDSSKLFESVILKIYNAFYDTTDFKLFKSPNNLVIDIISKSKQIAVSAMGSLHMEESRRGKGWVSKILERQFELISSKTPDAILALNTQRYWTVKFYEKLGFEILLEEKIGNGPLAFTNWTMRKIL